MTVTVFRHKFLLLNPAFFAVVFDRTPVQWRSQAIGVHLLWR
jgi:hypothetical protein